MLNRKLASRIFNSELKRKQRLWASRQPEFMKAQILKNEVQERIFDCVKDLAIIPSKILISGTPCGILLDKLKSELFIDDVTYIDDIDQFMKPGTVNYKPHEMVISNMNLHWVNDLEEHCLILKNLLDDNCPFMGSFIGGKSLYELKASLLQAEEELVVGVSPHLSPMMEMVDVGSLLKVVGFREITVYKDDIIIFYPSMLELMKHLQLMGESNSTYSMRNFLRRDVLKRADLIYSKNYAHKDGGISATFQIISFICWK